MLKLKINNVGVLKNNDTWICIKNNFYIFYADKLKRHEFINSMCATNVSDLPTMLGLEKSIKDVNCLKICVYWNNLQIPQLENLIKN